MWRWCALYSAGWNFRQFFSPYDSPGTLVFWCLKSLVGDARFPLKFAFKVTNRLSNSENAISLFLPVKFNFSRKKVCCKVFLCENFQRQKLYLHHSPIQRSIDRLRATSPSTWNWRSKWRTPSENADFQSFRLRVFKPWQLARILSAIKI